ncbi:MAG: flavin reductase like domain-containing protein [Podila humilis]|nr:MAG: flavin reductase like domain-containing protein [Podila humilis]
MAGQLLQSQASSSTRPFHVSSRTLSNSSTASPVPITPVQRVSAQEEGDKITSENLRKVLRKVPFPVVIVSTNSPTDPTQRRGITVSSFTSISLQPIPLIAFCVKLPSRASVALHESNQFVVQFLAEDQIAHSVAFSSSVAPPKEVTKRLAQDKDIEALVQEAGEQTLINGDKTPNGTSPSPSHVTTQDELDPFDVLGHHVDPESNLPVLDNTLGAIRCKPHRVLTVGDHEMWIGHVEKVLYGDIPGDPDQEKPLLYHDRSYRKVGRRIV